MITVPHWVKIKDKLFSFDIYREDQLSWKEQHEIHMALNLAYAFRTNSFFSKTYAYRVPVLRILCRFENTLVGHIAIFEDYVMVKNQKIKIAGIGLTLSLKPFSQLSFFLRQYATRIARQLGYAFAIGRVKNSPRVKKSLEPLVFCFLDIPLIGQSTRSHDWETLAIYNTGGSTDEITKLVEIFNTNKCIKIEGEIF